MHWKFTVQVQAKFFALFTAPSVMLRNPKFTTTGSSKKFSLLILCCVCIAPCSCSYWKHAVSNTLWSKHTTWKPEFSLNLNSIMQFSSTPEPAQVCNHSTRFWIWCHYYDHRWSLVWSVQNLLVKCSLIIFHIYQYCNFNSCYKEKEILPWILLPVTYPLLYMCNYKEIFTIMVSWKTTFPKRSSTSLRSTHCTSFNRTNLIKQINKECFLSWTQKYTKTRDTIHDS